MDDDELDYWIRRGKNTNVDSHLIDFYGVGGDLIQLWNLFGEIGERVRKMEENSGG